MSKSPKQEFKEVILNAVEYFEKRTGVVVKNIYFVRIDNKEAGKVNESIINEIELELK